MLLFNGIYLDNSLNVGGFKNYIDKLDLDKEVDNFILVRSFPQYLPSFELNHILCELGIRANNQVEMGYNCVTILNAMYISDSLNASSDTTTIIYLCDDLEGPISEQAIQKKSGVLKWKNFSSGIVFEPNGLYQIKINSFYSKSVNDLYKLIEFRIQENGYKIFFDEKYLNDFRKIDVEQEIEVIYNTLKKSNTKLADIDYIITTNRADYRMELLQEKLHFKSDRIIASRNIVGHTGGSDILYNLNTFIRDHYTDKLNYNLLLLGYGVGYTWACLQIELKKRVV